MAKGQRKVRAGRVVSDRMDKTIMVEVETLRQHPLYGHTVHRRRKLMAHDDANTCTVGDLVRIEESRPLSRHKRWRLIEVVQRAGEQRGMAVRPREVIEPAPELATLEAPTPEAPAISTASDDGAEAL